MELLGLFEELVGSADLAVLVDVQAVLEGLFVLVAAISNAFALLAFHLDGVILRHTG